MSRLPSFVLGKFLFSLSSLCVPLFRCVRIYVWVGGVVRLNKSKEIEGFILVRWRRSILPVRLFCTFDVSVFKKKSNSL